MIAVMQMLELLLTRGQLEDMNLQLNEVLHKANGLGTLSQRMDKTFEEYLFCRLRNKKQIFSDMYKDIQEPCEEKLRNYIHSKL